MDPAMAPINGISLERYAELGADVTDVNDPAEQARIVESKGVSRADWEAAKAGWTARMQDMSLMGRVAMAYMPLYQAAMARKGPVATVSYEDFCAMMGAAKAMTADGMCAFYGITQSKWSQIATQWTTTMGQDMMRYQSYSGIVESECARIRAGGQPKAVAIGQQAANPQAAAPAPAPAMGGGINVGAMVLVQWSDGNKYPGAVTGAQQGQYMVAFPDGRQIWIPAAYVSLR